MKHASEIIGLSVVSYETGQKFEKVEDIIFDEVNNKVLALLTDKAGLFSSAKVILLKDIRSVGEDAVIVASDSVEVSADTDPEVAAAIERRVSVKGKTVMTEDGKNLGKVSDLQLDETTGRIIGYKTSGGIFADMYKGQVVVPAPMTNKVGEDVVFVPNSTVALIEENMGGLRATAAAIGDKASELTESVKVKASDLKEQAADKYSEVKERVQSQETQDSLASLKNSAKEKFDMAKEKVAVTFDQAKEKAGDLKDQAAAKTSDIKDQASEQIEQNKINDALGRPVSKVILDRNDEVILNTGDIITNEAIMKAREAEMLNALLSAVHTGKGAVKPTDIKDHNAGAEHGSAAAEV